MLPLEEKITAALQDRGPSTPEELVEVGIARTAGALLKAARASGGRILQEGGRLFLPDQSEHPTSSEEEAGVLDGYVIFDLETTSAQADEAQFLELAAVRVRAGQEVDTFERLISGVVLPRVVAELTELTAEELQASGVPLQQALTEFKA